MRSVLALFFIFFFATINTQAQGFDAAILLGLNAAQLDGDELAGYNKLGLDVGLRVSYPIQEKTDVGLELLFSQRGSKTSRNTDPNFTSYTNLDYLAVPLFVNYKDWYIEDGDFYKVRAEGGLVYSYLFDVDSNYNPFEMGIGDFKNFDLGVHLGFGYALTKKWLFTLKWTSSFIRIFENPSGDGVRSYYLTFRFEYNL